MGTIGVIGLGRMGTAIAQRTAGQGQTVTGWTRSGRTVEGVETVDELRAVAEHSDTLILSLFDDQAVADVMDRLLGFDLVGKQIIETSTVAPDILKTRITAIEAAGATAIDAPISGGPELVAAGKCGVFIGGTDAAAERAKDTLSLISDRVFHVGPLGAGLVMKTINNGMLQTYFAGLADFLPLAARAGLPMETALKILAGGPAGTPFLNARLPMMLGEETTVGFTIAASKKDQEVFTRIVEGFDLQSPMLDRYGALSGAAMAEGMGEMDPAVFARWLYGNVSPA